MFDLNRIRMEQILVLCKLDIYKQTYLSHLSMERITGFEPATRLWKSRMLPLHYIRIFCYLAGLVLTEKLRLSKVHDSRTPRRFTYNAAPSL